MILECRRDGGKGSGDGARIARIKRWMLAVTGSGIALTAVFVRPLFAAGLLTGGGLVYINLLGTERLVAALTGQGQGKDGQAKWPALLIAVGKLGVTLAVVAAVMVKGSVPPLSFFLGVTILPLSVLMDLLVSPAREGQKKKDTDK
jgi:hypothetical protein